VTIDPSHTSTASHQGSSARYWPDGGALGQIRFDEDSTEPSFTIVGISGDVRQLGLKHTAPPLLYFPYTQFPLPFTTMAVKSALPAAAVSEAIRGVLKAVDAELPVPEVSTLQSVVDRSLSEARFRAFGGFLFGVTGTDPLVFAGVSAILLGVAMAASYLPARRALRVDPMTALRAE
jgi:hypothetical protein